MDSPTSEVDSMCSSCQGGCRLPPVKLGTFILTQNLIPSVDKPALDISLTCLYFLGHTFTLALFL